MDFKLQTGEELFQILLIVILTFMVLIMLIAVINVYFVARSVLDKKMGITRDPFSFGSFWERFNALRPIQEEEAITLDHNYDGIRELDNHLPPWWLGMFYGGIAFAVIYLLNYHVWHWSPTQSEEYEIAMAEAAEIKMANLADEGNAIDESNVALVTDASGITEGSNIYAGNCVACHGKLGEGGVGPNLTDEFWLHGGGINDIFKTIKYGVPEKGMIPWDGTLSPSQMQNVASFITTLIGTNPPNGKAPQGEKYVPAAPVEEESEETANPIALVE